MSTEKEQSVRLEVSPGEMETKMLLSHKSLWNCIGLLEHVKKSVRYIDEETKRKKLLCYLIRFFEVFCKFCEVYFNYKPKCTIDRFNHNSAAEVNNVCEFTTELLKLVKVRVSVILRENPKAQDIIKNMCFKAIAKFQHYLVAIDFFNKEMFRKSALNLC